MSKRSNGPNLALVLGAGALALMVCVTAMPATAASISAYYPLDTNLDDAVGNNDGTSANETHATIMGRMALDTNPANSQAVVAGSGWSGNAFSNDQIAFSFWQLDAAASNSSTFWASTAGGVAGNRRAQAHVPWGNGTIFWDTAGCCGGGQRITTGSGDTNDGFWHHFVFQKNGGQKQIWKDGALLVNQASGANALLAFSNLTLGTDAGGGNRLTGYIDEFAVWDQALTQTEIVQLANGVNPLNVAGIVPEPSTFLMTVLGLFAMGLFRRRRRA